VCLLSGANAPKHAVISQPHVDADNLHPRILAVVPLVGTGKKGDPIRPQYVPLPLANGTRLDPNGIIGYTVQVCDDKKHAIVEMVARKRSAFAQIMADTSPDVKVFEKGKAKKADIQAEFAKWKKTFDLDHIKVRVP
jgi:hypothetical protein